MTPSFFAGFVLGSLAAPFIIFFGLQICAWRERRRAARRLELVPAPRPLCQLEPPPSRGHHLQLVVTQPMPRGRQ